MQDDSLEASTSISQLLRESYLAESRIHQRHSEVSRSESNLQHSFYESITGNPEDLVTQDDFTDLSAFLSQEELDKSVNLAREAIAQCPKEIKLGEKEQGKAPLVDLGSQQTTPVIIEKQTYSSFRQENVYKSSRDPLQEPRKPTRNSPYGSDSQCKKEFLNKAADFIEELSSLFKANSSKRIRPRACKANRSRYQSKAQSESSSYSYTIDERERPAAPIASQLIEEVTLDENEPEMLPEEEDENTAEVTEIEPLEESTEESASDTYYSEQPLGVPPSFIQKLKSREVPEGSKVQLDCIVTGVPTPEVRWFCEGKELENSPDIQILNVGELHSLIITEAFEEDTGRYSCFASNFYGTDSTSAEIYIEGASSSESEGEQNIDNMPQIQKKTSVSTTITSTTSGSEAAYQETSTVRAARSQPVTQLPAEKCQSPSNYPKGLDGRPLMAAPVFTKMLQDLTAYEGQLVVLECRVKGAPSPKVEWYREGTLIEDSPDFRILQKKPRTLAEQEEICTLVIAEVFPEDSGTFTCTASNKYGTVSSIASLNVKGNQNNSSSLQATHTSLMVESSHQKTSRAATTDPPGCLKTKLVNHNEPRSSSKAGLRVHFKLPEDDKESEDSSDEGILFFKQQKSDLRNANGQLPGGTTPMPPGKEPPPVLAKPKLDPVQLQLLHNQVLLEQQQESGTHSQMNPSFTMSVGPVNSGPAAFQQPPTSPPSSGLPQTFNYARPKQFIAAQSATIVTSLPSTESPVLSPNLMPPVSQTSRNETFYIGSPSSGFSQPRVLQSPTSPTRFVSSPPPAPSVFSPFTIRPQSPLQAASPTLSSSTPSPIQDPVAFLSSVLPSLPTSPPTNAMGLPRSAPAVSSQVLMKKNLKPSRSTTDDEIRDSKDAVLHDLEKKLRFKEEPAHNGQHRFTYEEKMARRLLGPNNSPTVFNFEEVQESPPSQEYKVSSFEQRLMSEIEFRLERTPVEESDDEIQHDEIPTGKCIAPIFDKKLKHFRVVEGTAVTFTCKVVGIPVPKVYWFKDGKQISKKNEHYKMKREGDGTCSLVIEATTNDDDGNYTIMAANPQGRISCSGHLLVQTGPIRRRLTPTIHSQRVRSRSQEGDEGEPIQERFFRPHFLQAPGDLVAHEGRLCRLDCKVSGLPNPDLMWLLNGKPIYSDNNHKMLVRENGVHSLLIDPLMQSDAGTYTCIATNKAGQNSFSLELSVVAKEVKKAPVFLEKLQNTGIPEGTPVRLECRVVGMPPPLIFWKKDNDTIPVVKERMSMHQDATGYVCLLIQPTRKEDAGWYTVSAKNEAGIVSCTARLDIYAQWHQQIPQPMKKVRSSGSRYAALTGQGLDILSAFPSTDSSPSPFSPSAEGTVESEEL
ncbi:myopalladin isoform X2 [Polypterus senegalus]|uniref:myopalladin isoform X2 n=1 Tax=Polypterus senegalus TaxID=55291 RepID=UPI0019646962|nr:myopalladin isoform X2 [Polypterus senegalus]